LKPALPSTGGHEEVDRRLVALVRAGWEEDVFAGHLFVFISKRRDRVKVLTWDSGGFVVFYKRREQGRFRLPSFQEGALGAQLDATQLAMLLDGIDLSRVRRPKKWSPQATDGDRQRPESLIYPGRWQPARRRCGSPLRIADASGGARA